MIFKLALVLSELQLHKFLLETAPLLLTLPQKTGMHCIFLFIFSLAYSLISLAYSWFSLRVWQESGGEKHSGNSRNVCIPVLCCVRPHKLRLLEIDRKTLGTFVAIFSPLFFSLYFASFGLVQDQWTCRRAIGDNLRQNHISLWSRAWTFSSSREAIGIPGGMNSSGLLTFCHLFFHISIFPPPLANNAGCFCGRNISRKLPSEK